LQGYNVQHPRRQSSSQSLLWEVEILRVILYFSINSAVIKCTRCLAKPENKWVNFSSYTVKIPSSTMCRPIQFITMHYHQHLTQMYLLFSNHVLLVLSNHQCFICITLWRLLYTTLVRT
jgi:hypothetical protein